MRNMRHWILALMTVLTACEPPAFLNDFPLIKRNRPGRFEVEFRWRAPKPAANPLYFVFGRVVDNTDGQINSSVGPIPYTDAVELPFDDVPNGPRKVVLVEIRYGNTQDAQVLYYGRSAEFEIVPGETVVVPVELDVVATPGRPGDGSGAVRIDAATPDGDLALVRDSNVSLLFTTDTGVTVRVSNTPAFEAVQEVRLDTLTVEPGAPQGFTRHRMAWDLSSGNPAPCEDSNRCTRTVYVRFLDAQGYASPLFTASALLDTVAPGLVAEGTRVNPEVARPQSRLLVDLTATEKLAVAPSLTVDGAPGFLFELLPDTVMLGDGGVAAAFVYRYQSVTAVEELIRDAGGAVPAVVRGFTLTAQLQDLAGNVATVTNIPPFTVDSTLPDVVVANSSALPTLLRAGMQLDIRFETTKALDLVGGWRPAVSLGGVTIESAQPTSSAAGQEGREFSLSHTITELIPSTGTADPEGELVVSVELRDRAGNIVYRTLPGTVTVDRLAPQLSTQVNTPVGAGAPVIFTVVTNEPLSMLDPPEVRDAGGTLVPGFFTLQGAATVGTLRFTFLRDVGQATVDGAYTTRLRAVDRAGNEATLDGTPFTVDRTPPNVLNMAVTPGHKRLRTGVVFSAAFDVTETPAADPAVVVSPAVGGAGRAMACMRVAGSPPDLADHYVCTLTPELLDVEGPQTVTAFVEDAAGNTGYGSVDVEYDFTAPALVAADITPAAAKFGDTVSVALTPSEALEGAFIPELTVGGPAPIVFSYQVGTAYVFKRVMDGTEPDGSYGLSVGLRDVAGNEAVVAPATPTVRIDSQAPVITNVAVGPRQRFSRNAGFNNLSVSFVVGEPLTAANLTVRMGTRTTPLTCVLTTSGGSTSVTCDTTVEAGDGEGTQYIDVVARDDAGNIGLATTSAEFDFTPPALVSVTRNREITPLNEDLVYTFNVTEALGADPTVVVTGPAVPVFSYVANTRYTFTHRVTAADTQGAYALAVELVDTVGNTATVTPAGADLEDAAFRLDPGVPSVSNVRVQRRSQAGVLTAINKFSGLPDFSTMVVDFDVSEDVTGTGLLEVTVAGQAMTCGAYTTGGARNHTCTYVVPAAPPIPTDEGLNEVLVLLRDEAGNASSESALVLVDRTPPSVGSTRAVPSAAKVGDRILYTVVPTEVLAAPPTLQVTGPGAATLAFTYQPDTFYTSEYVVLGTEPEGVFQVTIALEDEVGNVATGITGTSIGIDDFSLDTTVPVISNLSVNRTRLSRVAGFNQLVATFDVSEDVALQNESTNGSFVAVGGARLVCNTRQAASPNHTCSYTLALSDVDGIKDVEVVARDAAGNTGTTRTRVEFDFTAPSVLGASPSKTLSKLGDDVIYTLFPSETLAATPTFTATRNSGTETLAFSHETGTTYSFRHVVTAADVDGAYTVAVTLLDSVGNSATVTLSQAAEQFSVDATVPVLGTPVLNSRTRSRVAGFQTLTMTFTASEVLTVANVTARVDTLDAACVTSTGLSFTCTYTVGAGDTEGRKTISITGMDAAGNAGSATETVDFDFTAPSLLSTSLSTTLAGLGDEIVYTLNTSETLSNTPTPEVSGLTFTLETGTTFTFRHVVTAADANGDYSAVFDLVDGVGNRRDNVSDGKTFAVDATVPTISNMAFAGGRTRYSRVAGFSTITLTFNLSENVGAGLVVTADGRAMTCNAYQAAAPNHTCTYVVAAVDTEGVKSIAVGAEDVAGNRSDASQTVTYDFTAPTLLSTSLSTTLAGLGEEIVYTLNASETLSNTPTPEVTGLTFTLETGTTFTFRHVVTAADVNGSYAAVFDLVDTVGNRVDNVSDGKTVAVDATVPAISAVTLVGGRTRYSRVAGFNSITLTFNLSENVGTGLVVTADGRAMACNSYQAAAPNHTCSYTVAAVDTEGVKTIAVGAQDAAGNRSDATQSVEYDFTAPSISDSGATPTPGKIGDTLLYRLTPSEVLSAAPTVTFQSGAPAFTYVPSSSYVYTHTLAENGPAGTFTVTVSMTDQAGNSATGLAAASLAVDGVRPTISNLTIANSRRSAVTGFNVTSVEFDLTDNAGSTPTLAVGLDTPSGTFACTGASHKTCTYTVTGTEGSGFHQVVVEARDVAGNSRRAEVGVTLDFSAPTLLASEASPALVGYRRSMTYRLRVSEPLAANPVVTTTPAIALSHQSTSGNEYIYGGSLSGAETSGTYTVAVALTDALGNAATVAGTSFAVDSTVPTLSNVTLNETRFSTVAGYSTVQVSFDLTENVASGGTLTAVVGRSTMACNTFQAASPNHTCTHTVVLGDGEGPQDLTVVVADAAGNTDAYASIVEFDFTPPTLASSQASPTLAALAATLDYQVTPSEPVAATPVVSLTPATFALVHRAGSTYVYQHTVAATDSGTYAVGVQMTDLVGNTSAVLAGQGFSVDAVAPQVSLLSVNASAFSRVAGFNTVTVRVHTSEELERSQVTVTVGDATVNCSFDGAFLDRFLCTGVLCTGSCPSDGLPGVGEGAQSVLVVLRDDAGNTGTDSTAITVDYTAPAVVVGSTSLQYVAAATNPIRFPSALTAGTRARVAFTATEALSADPTVASSVPEVLAFSKDSSVGNAYQYSHTLVGAGHAQGDYTVTAAMTDPVGNQATVALTLSPVLTVDTVAPAVVAVDSSDRVAYARVPWGSNATSDQPSLTVTGFSGAAESSSTVIVYATAAGNQEVGRGDADSGGAFGPISLDTADRPEVYVSAVDAAGNVSTRRKVRDVVWQATMGGKTVGSTFPNPHTFQERRVLLDLLNPNGSIEVGSGKVDKLGEGQVLATSGAGRWVERAVDGVTSPLYGHAAAYDRARGVMVVFGGTKNVFGSNVTSDDTLEWNGYAWSLRTPTDPEGDGEPLARVDAAATYDLRRNRTVMFGGDNGSVIGDTWEWDGLSWKRMSPTGTPAFVARAAMAFDAHRGRVVLYGGCINTSACTTLSDQTWEYDGTAWTRTALTGAPPGRYWHAMAYDANRKRVVMHGGCTAAACGTVVDETWEYNGDTGSWTLLTLVGTTPGPRSRHAMAFDDTVDESGGPTRNTTVLLGGCAACPNQVMEFNGTWSTPVPGDPELDGNPDQRFRHSAVFDSVRNRVVVFGGQDGGGVPASLHSVWEWNGASFEDRSADNLANDGNPTGRSGAALAWHTGLRRLVLFGGRDGESGSNVYNATWTWTGGGWTVQAPSTNPTARWRHAMSNDPASGDVIMFGGVTLAGVCETSTSGLCNSTWRFNGTNWIGTAAAVGHPVARLGAAMAPLPAPASNNGVIMFGGQAAAVCETSGNANCNATWRWQTGTTSWSNLVIPGVKPTGRYGHAMAYYPEESAIFMVGGTDGSANCDGSGSALCLVWKFDGTAWVQVTLTNLGDGTPANRFYPSLAYDPGRKVLILTGGDSSVTGGGLSRDVWEFNGVGFKRITTVDPDGDSNPVARKNQVAGLDALRGEVVLAMGEFNGGALFDDAWVLRGGHDSRPGHVMKVDLQVAGINPAHVLAVDVNWVAGGSISDSAGLPNHGAQLMVWDLGRWIVGPAHTSASNAPALLTFSTTDTNAIMRLFAGDSQTLTTAARPRANAGRGTGQGTVSTDYAVIALKYRLP